MSRPIIFSIPTLTARVGQPYVYQVRARMGSDNPMEQLKLALAALDDALTAYDQSMSQAMQMVNSQLVSVRDAINVILEGSDG